MVNQPLIVLQHYEVIALKAFSASLLSIEIVGIAQFRL